jgi:hypothetical protein
VRTDSLIVGPGGIKVEGNISIAGGLTASGPVLHSGDVLVEGDVTFAGDTYTEGTTTTSTPAPGGGDGDDADLVAIEVVTDVTWDGSSLIKTIQTVYVARVANGNTGVVVSGTSCPTAPLNASASNWSDMP